MSWYRNPNIFLRCKGSKHRFHVYRIEKKFRHLSLGNNQESDYDGLKSWLNEDGVVTKYVNRQGLMITGSAIENDWTSYTLPGIINRYEIKLADKRADEKKISDLQDKLEYEVTKLNSEVTYLQEQLNQEKNYRQAQVYDFTTKLEELSGARGGSAVVQPWTSGDTVSSHLVPSEDLYVTSSPNNTSVTIIEGSSSRSRVEEDDSTLYGLPGITNPSDRNLAEKLAFEKKMSELVAQNSILRERLNDQLSREKTFYELVAKISTLEDKFNNEVTNLKNQLSNEKNDRQAQVSDLTAKLEECRGAGSGVC
ncbi:hypothetical protein MKX03_027277 [Papaver bracteatum]|nr:hypothetical protein MKX03_027277 [Papaver bracteatum]